MTKWAVTGTQCIVVGEKKEDKVAYEPGATFVAERNAQLTWFESIGAITENGKDPIGIVGPAPKASAPAPVPEPIADAPFVETTTEELPPARPGRRGRG